MDRIHQKFLKGFVKEARVPYTLASRVSNNKIAVAHVYPQNSEDFEKDAKVRLKSVADVVDDFDLVSRKLELGAEDVNDLLPTDKPVSKLNYGIVGQGGEGSVAAFRDPSMGDIYAVKSITDPGNFGTIKKGLTGSERFDGNFNEMMAIMSGDSAFPKIHNQGFSAYSTNVLPEEAVSPMDAVSQIARRDNTALTQSGGRYKINGVELTDLDEGNVRLTAGGEPKIVDFSTAAGDQATARTMDDVGQHMSRQQQRNPGMREQAQQRGQDAMGQGRMGL